MGFGHCGAFICLYTLFPFSLLSLLSLQVLSFFLPLFLSSASHWRRMLQVSGSRFRVWRSWVAVTIRMPVMSWTGWSRRVRAVQNRSTPTGCPADAPSKPWVCCFRVSMLLNSWIFPVKMKPDWCILMFDLLYLNGQTSSSLIIYMCFLLWVDQLFILNAVPDEASVNGPEISAAFGLTCQDCDKTHKGSIICRQVIKWSMYSKVTGMLPRLLLAFTGWFPGCCEENEI